MRPNTIKALLVPSNLSDDIKKPGMALRLMKKDDRKPKNAKCSADLFGGSSSKTMTTVDDGLVHCAVPLVSCVRRGDPLPTSVKNGGVKMLCTNDKCQYVGRLMHGDCFEQLESTLIKMISNMGSARGWTDNQRRNNLWEKKGLTLIQKHLRCHCDMGLMRLDNTPPPIAPTPVIDAKGKKKKKKELPKLNFGYNACATPSDNAEVRKRFCELDSNFLSSHRDDSYDDCNGSITSSDVSSNNWQGKQNGFETPKRQVASVKAALRKTVNPGKENSQPVDASSSSSKKSVQPESPPSPPPSVWKTIVLSAAPTPIPPAPKKTTKKDSPPQLSLWPANGLQQEQPPLKTNGTPPSVLETPSPSPPPTSMIDQETAPTIPLPPPASWTSVVQSSMKPVAVVAKTTTPTENNNVVRLQDAGFQQYSVSLSDARNSLYSLFGHGGPSFLLGERIMADLYLPRRSFV